VEIGIPRGRFQVIRVHPNPDQPDGAFIIRIQDNESGITVVTTLLTDDGLKLAAGFSTDNDPQQAGSVIHMPDAKEIRVHAGGNGGDAELEEPAAPAPAPDPLPPPPPPDPPPGP
jgi:hypothetical protein